MYPQWKEQVIVKSIELREREIRRSAMTRDIRPTEINRYGPVPSPTNGAYFVGSASGLQLEDGHPGMPPPHYSPEHHSHYSPGGKCQ